MLSKAPKAVLIDVDGTLMGGGIMIEGADQLLRSVADRFVLLSNDAEHTAPELAARLANLGLFVPPSHIVLAGVAMIDAIHREFGPVRTLLVASEALLVYARELGLQTVDDDPDVVALARDRSFTFDKLARAANAVRAGAKLFVANPDVVHPGAGLAVVPETGALLAAVLACTGPVAFRVIGKPQARLFEHALSLLDAEPHEAIMIGDNADTDGRGAGELGVTFLSAQSGLKPVLSRLCRLGFAATAMDRLPMKACL